MWMAWNAGKVVLFRLPSATLEELSRPIWELPEAKNDKKMSFLHLFGSSQKLKM